MSDGGEYTFEQTAAAALAGVSTVAVVQLLELASLDMPLKIALYCFAISIPMLVTFWCFYTNKANNLHDSRSEVFAGTIGMGCSLTGLGAIFWHFSVSIGITFMVATFIGFSLFAIGSQRDD